MNANSFQRPRVLSIELEGSGVARAALEPWSASDPALDRIGSWGGSATSVAIHLRRLRTRSLLEGGRERSRTGSMAAARSDEMADLVADAARRDAGEALVVCIGERVREHWPTAARACVSGISPLTGRYVEGHVGSDLARRLATIADALVIEGRAEGRGNVLVVDAHGGARVERLPQLDGASPARCGELVRAHLGACGLLCIGPAGEARVPFASLASGASPPSFVGRGGLGAVLGARGLKALAILAPVREAPPVSTGERGASTAREITALLSRSPRLRARSEWATLEIAEAARARGEPLAPAWGDDSSARALANAREGERKGCAGCPTPCGVVFERGVGAHFSALEAFARHGEARELDGALEQLAACDELGLDAIESAQVLALLRRAHALEAGAGAARAVLARLVADAAAPGSRGAVALARELGLEEHVHALHGQAVRPDRSRATRLGLLASARGGDPLRTLAFLAGDAPSRAMLERLVAPEALALGAEDPADPRGKAQIVWWSENLANAVDASGFCAFSAAALLLDGCATLDELAGALLPERERSRADPRRRGETFLALGASIALAQRALAAELAAELAARAHARRGEPPREDDSRVEEARGDETRDTSHRDVDSRAASPSDAVARVFPASEAWLEEERTHAEGWPEYARRRGLDANGAPRADLWARIGDPALLELARSRGPSAAIERAESAPRSHMRAATRPGRVHIRASGALGAALGRELHVELALPCRVDELVRVLASEHPAAAAWLVRGGELVPSTWRGGARLDARTLVEDGDVLDLVVAISGG